MTHISNYKNFVESVPVNPGSRGGSRYCLKSDDGTEYMLQVNNIKVHKQKQFEFKHMQNLAELGIAMPMPLDFGTCNEGVYVLTSRVDGKNLQTAMPQLSNGAQYMLGIKAGRILHETHTLNAPADDWQSVLIDEVDKLIEAYYRSNMLIPGMEKILDFIEQNKFLLTFVRPQCYLHGDFAEYNLAIKNYEIIIADFGGAVHVGDPWYDFSRLIRGDQSAIFATGVVQGYFDAHGKDLPADFWPLMTLYTCIDVLKLTVFRHKKAPSRLKLSMAHIANIIKWYKNMTTAVPAWYKNDNKEILAELHKCDSNAADSLIALSEFSFPGVTADTAIPNAVLLLIDRLQLDEHELSSAYFLAYAYHSISNDEYLNKAISIAKTRTPYDDAGVDNAAKRVSALILIAMLQVLQKGMELPDAWLTKIIRNHELWLKQNGNGGIQVYMALLLCEGYPY